MLIDKINDCISAIDNSTALQNQALSEEAFKKAVDGLLGAEKDLHKYCEGVKAVHESRLGPIKLENNEIGEINSKINECGQACAGNELTIQHAEALSQLIARHSMLLNVFWKGKVQEQTKPLIRYVSALKSISKNGASATSLVKRLKECEELKPSNSSCVQLEAVIKEAEVFSESFRLTETIESFLSAINNGTATIRTLTPEIVEWIKEMKLEDSIHLHF